MGNIMIFTLVVLFIVLCDIVISNIIETNKIISDVIAEMIKRIDDKLPTIHTYRGLCSYLEDEGWKQMDELLESSVPSFPLLGKDTMIGKCSSQTEKEILRYVGSHAAMYRQERVLVSKITNFINDTRRVNSPIRQPIMDGIYLIEIENETSHALGRKVRLAPIALMVNVLIEMELLIPALTVKARESNRELITDYVTGLVEGNRVNM